MSIEDYREPSTFPANMASQKAAAGRGIRTPNAETTRLHVIPPPP